MKKLMNQPDRFVDDVLEGIMLAHPDSHRLLDSDPRVVLRAHGKEKGKVAIVTGGGSGHLPLFLGYVGEGLADACAVGNVFSSPGSGQILNATRAAHAGAGVLYLFGHYQGDQMNFEMAAMMAGAEGIKTRTVMGCDDVASAPMSQFRRRRAVAGMLFAYKIVGAAAEDGMQLEELATLADDVARNTRSMGVALSMCVQPQIGRTTVEIPEGEMAIGMGIHGEPGIGRASLMSADAAVKLMLERITEEMDCRGERVALLVNGLGATSPEELYILNRAARRALSAAGAEVAKGFVGNYATSLDMMGASLSLLKLDARMERLLEAPAYSPLLRLL